MYWTLTGHVGFVGLFVFSLVVQYLNSTHELLMNRVSRPTKRKAALGEGLRKDRFD